MAGLIMFLTCQYFSTNALQKADPGYHKSSYIEYVVNAEEGDLFSAYLASYIIILNPIPCKENNSTNERV